jgi:hypothetical protein
MLKVSTAGGVSSEMAPQNSRVWWDGTAVYLIGASVLRWSTPAVSGVGGMELAVAGDCLGDEIGIFAWQHLEPSISMTTA